MGIKEFLASGKFFMNSNRGRREGTDILEWVVCADMEKLTSVAGT